jgi:regulator of sigma E protease
MQILAGIILLGVLIVFHELGHFLFAKWLGVRVLVFSVGFGPKIWGFKRGETEYRLSAIPLGGYVRMFGESVEDNLAPEEKKISFMHQPIWRKSLIAFAGPLFNFVLPIILFFFLLFGVEQVFAPKIGTLVKGGIAAQSGLKVGDEIVAVNGQPVSSFNDVAETIAKSPNVEVSLDVRRQLREGAVENLVIKVVPEGRPSTNPLEKDVAIGRIGVMPASESPAVVVSDMSSLKASGLKTFDEIIEVNGRPITNADELNAALLSLQAGQKLLLKRQATEADKPEQISLTVPPDIPLHFEPKPVVELDELNIGKPAIMASTKKLVAEDALLLGKSAGVATANGTINVVEADSIADKLGLRIEDRIVSIDGERMLSSAQLQQALIHEPSATHVLGVIKKDGTPMVIAFALPKDAADKIGLQTDLLNFFGISTTHVFKSGEIIERHVGVFEAITRATEQTVEIAWMTAKSLWLLVKMEVPASQIGGPIMLFDVAQQAAGKGLPYYIFIMCLLSVNLGLLNLLPIPALDGGHLLLFGIEAVQRKPLTPRTRMIATQIGIALLLMLMAFAIFNDLMRIFR